MNYLEFLRNKSTETLKSFLDALAGDTKKKALVKISEKINRYYGSKRIKRYT